MELTVKTVATLILALIILIAILLLLDIIPSEGGPVNVRARLYLCCSKFLANDCIESRIIICDDETGETMDTLRDDLKMSWENVKEFCNCPEV